MTTLPNGWTTATLGSLGVWRGGGTPSKGRAEFWTDGTIPWVSPKDMKRHFINSAEDYITEAAVNGSATQIVPASSILVVTRSGILRHSIPVAINTREVAINQDLKALTPSHGIDPEFILAQLRAMESRILADCTKSGTTVDSVEFEKLKGFEVGIAPTDEQHRIVTKINSLSTKSKRAHDHLDHVPRLVEKYKEAILKTAMCGDLTREWRAACGAPGPEGWSYVRWADAGETLSGRAFPSSDYSGNGVKLLRPGNLHQSGAVVWNDKNTTFLPDKYADEFPKYAIRGSHVLINLTAQSLKDQFLGRACLSGDNDTFLLNQRIALFSPKTMSKKFCLFVLKSPLFRRFVDEGLNSGSLIQHIHTKQLREFVFPIPSEAEQAEIVRRVETAFASIDRLASEATSAQKLINHLDQAILSKAFRGELVSQDPNDEPASVLLERGKAEKAKESGKRRVRR